MSVANHRCAFRPTRGGTLLFQPGSGEAGTLGMTLTSDGLDRWLLTCYHVLARKVIGIVPNDIILQPDAACGPIADLRMSIGDPAKDVIAVKLLVPATDEVLGFSPLTAWKAPQVGMTVVKSGWKTGISEGRVQQITDSDVVIERLPGYPAEYLLAATGDSGAVWLEASTLAPVAVHRAESVTGPHQALATIFEAALSAVNLRQAC